VEKEAVVSELGEMHEAIQGNSRVNRANNREQSAKYLTDACVPFTTHNQGAHLVVEGKDCYIDFWPGTGKWITRNNEKGFGVRNLVNFITG